MNDLNLPDDPLYSIITYSLEVKSLYDQLLALQAQKEDIENTINSIRKRLRTRLSELDSVCKGYIRDQSK